MSLRMRLNFKTLIPILVLVSMCQGIGTGFLLIPVSVDELALCSNPVMGLRSNANPALVSLNTGEYRVTVSSGLTLGGTRSSLLDFDRQRQGRDWRTQIRYVGIDGIEFRSAYPTDESLSQYGAYGLVGAQQVAFDYHGFRVGAAIKYIWMQLYDRSAKGGALDLGMTRSISPKFSVGASILNMGYITAFISRNSTLPLRILGGGSYRLDSGQIKDNIAVSGEFSSQVQGLILRVSNQIDWQQIQLLLGTETSKKVTTVSTGVKIRTGRFDIGYAIRFGNQGLGLPQYFELSARLP